MRFCFLDSSALVKRYAVETGSGWVQTLTTRSSGNRIFIAQITPLEITATLARKKREANIPERTLQAAVLLLERHVVREYIVVRLNTQVEQEVKRLLLSHTLRTADAIQLASAMVIYRQLNIVGLGDLEFMCGDIRLKDAAKLEGLVIDDPYQHP